MNDGVLSEVSYLLDPETLSIDHEFIVNEEEFENLGVNPDFEALTKINPDLIGYVFIPESNIDTPVVQGQDNSYYLSHSFAKESNYSGCAFVDWQANPAEDQSMVVHGHNMGRDQTVQFSTLVKYQEESFLKEHPMIYYAAKDQSFQKYEIFSVFNFNVRRLQEFNYMQRTFEDYHEFFEWVANLSRQSMFFISYQPQETDRILILSTCNGVYGRDNRLLVCSRLVVE